MTPPAATTRLAGARPAATCPSSGPTPHHSHCFGCDALRAGASTGTMRRSTTPSPSTWTTAGPTTCGCRPTAAGVWHTSVWASQARGKPRWSRTQRWCRTTRGCSCSQWGSGRWRRAARTAAWSRGSSALATRTTSGTPTSRSRPTRRRTSSTSACSTTTPASRTHGACAAARRPNPRSPARLASTFL